MREYGKVAPTFWTGHTGKQIRAMGPDAQVIALYLMTSPHANMLGLYYLPLPYIAHETGSPFEGACKALQSLSEASFCSYDHDAEMVFVHEMAKYQIGEELKPTDKRVLGIERELSKLPKTNLIHDFMGRYAGPFHLSSNGKKTSPSEAPCKPLRSQEQEQEQEQEKNILRQEGAVDPTPHDEIISAYHEILPELPKVRVWSDKKRKELRARWREDKRRQSVDWWRRFFTRIRDCEFLMGAKTEWQANLGWIVQAGNFEKIMNGQYISAKKAQPSDRPEI